MADSPGRWFYSLYGFAPVASILRLMEHEGVNISRSIAPRMFAYMLAITGRGDWDRFNDDPWKTERIDDFLWDKGLCGRGATSHDLLLSCFTRRQAADATFNGNTSSVARALKELEDAGIIAEVARGTKGHASLWVLLPVVFEDAEGMTRLWNPKGAPAECLEAALVHAD